MNLLTFSWSKILSASPFVLKRRHRGCIYLCNHSNMNLLSGSNMKEVSIYGQLILSLLFIRWCIIFLKKFQIIRIKADSPLTRLSALNSSRHIQFHYYLISSEPDNFLSYHNLYGFHHLHTEYSCCLHIR